MAQSPDAAWLSLMVPGMAQSHGTRHGSVSWLIRVVYGLIRVVFSLTVLIEPSTLESSLITVLTIVLWAHRGRPQYGTA